MTWREREPEREWVKRSPELLFLLKLQTCSRELGLLIQIVSLTMSLGLHADPSEKLIPVSLSVLHTMAHSQWAVWAHVTPVPDVLNSPPPSAPHSGDMLVAGLCPKPKAYQYNVCESFHSFQDIRECLVLHSSVPKLFYIFQKLHQTAYQLLICFTCLIHLKTSASLLKY